MKGHVASSEVSLMTPASNQQGFPERFRRGSRDLGPGREGPSSLRVTWKEGRWVILLVLSCPLPAFAPGTFGSCWVEAVGRGSQAQGLWVLHISQPGRLGALMKVHDGQGQPG